MKNKIFSLAITILLLGAVDAQAQGIPTTGLQPMPAPTRFDLCQQNAKTMKEAEACIVTEENAVQEELDKMTAALMEGAVQGDENIPGYDIAKKLQASKQSFAAYMQDQCDYIKARYTNGSIAGTAYLACRTSLMKERVEMLKPEQ